MAPLADEILNQIGKRTQTSLCKGPRTTIPLRSPFRQPSTFASAGMTRSSDCDRWNRTTCSLFRTPGDGLDLPDMIWER